MDVLIRGALQWGRTSEMPDEHAHVDDDLMDAYSRRLRDSKRNPSPAAPALFAALVTELGVSKQDTRVVAIQDHDVFFHPLLVRPGETVRDQSACFAALVEYWLSTPEPISTLTVDVSDATMPLIRECMRGVTVSDVLRGIRIWETLPCKIHQIIVYEPVGMPKLWWSVRRLATMTLPAKVLRKVRFAQKAHIESSPHGDADAHDDVIAGTFHDPLDVHVTSPQKRVE